MTKQCQNVIALSYTLDNETPPYAICSFETVNCDHHASCIHFARDSSPDSPFSNTQRLPLKRSSAYTTTTVEGEDPWGRPSVPAAPLAVPARRGEDAMPRSKKRRPGVAAPSQGYSLQHLPTKKHPKPKGSSRGNYDDHRRTYEHPWVTCKLIEADQSSCMLLAVMQAAHESVVNLRYRRGTSRAKKCTMIRARSRSTPCFASWKRGPVHP